MGLSKLDKMRYGLQVHRARGKQIFTTLSQLMRNQTKSIQPHRLVTKLAKRLGSMRQQQS